MQQPTDPASPAEPASPATSAGPGSTAGSAATPTPPPSDRARVRRLPDRGRYDRATIDAILDDAVIGHVGFVVDGQPYVTTTCVWRTGDRLYWHGSATSRTIRAARDGAPMCITISHLDGMVLARSGFEHSVNYRSVMALGRAHEVTDEDEKLAALEAFIEHLWPGRWAELRPATRKELKATGVAWVDLAEASAKVRADVVTDVEGDESWPAWAGVVPVTTHGGDPEPDGFVPDGMPLPAYLRRAGGRLTGPTG